MYTVTGLESFIICSRNGSKITIADYKSYIGKLLAVNLLLLLCDETYRLCQNQYCGLKEVKFHRYVGNTLIIRHKSGGGQERE